MRGIPAYHTDRKGLVSVMGRFRPLVLAALLALLGACADSGGAATSTNVIGDQDAQLGEEPLQPVISCLERHGFHAEIDPADGALSASFPTDQREVYREVLAACMSDSGFDMQAERPQLTHEDYERLFDAHMETVECLQSEGLPTTPPPSLEAFVESNGEVWHSYDAVAADDSMPISEWDRINQVCPQP